MSGSATAAATGAVLDAAWEVAQLARRLAPERDQTGDFPDTEFAALAEAGLLTAPLPRAAGGLGLGSEPGQMAVLLEVLAVIGWGSLPLARLYEGHVNALLLISRFGSVAQRARAATETAAGHRFAVWNTEAADGVTVQAAGEGRYRLHGSKTFASGAGSISRPLVTGRLPDGGWRMVLLALDDAGERVDTTWWRPLGMHASASHRIDFTGLLVGPDALLGEPGDYYRQPWFSGGAIRFAA
ncbi:MAG: acyl-CoA dehydrogenase family protein, partial [Thermomicrobiales bacterium]